MTITAQRRAEIADDIVKLVVNIECMQQENLAFEEPHPHSDTKETLETTSDAINSIKKDIEHNKCLFHYLMSTFPYEGQGLATVNFQNLNKYIMKKFKDHRYGKSETSKNFSECRFITIYDKCLKDACNYHKEYIADYYPIKGQPWLSLPFNLPDKSKNLSEESKALADEGHVTRYFEAEKFELDITNQVIASKVTITKYAEYQAFLDASIRTLRWHIWWLNFFKDIKGWRVVNPKITELNALILKIENIKRIENINDVPSFVENLTPYMENLSFILNLKEVTFDENLIKYYQYKAVVTPIVAKINWENFLLEIRLFFKILMSENTVLMLKMKLEIYSTLLNDISNISTDNLSTLRKNISSWGSTPRANTNLVEFSEIVEELHNSIEEIEHDGSKKFSIN